MELIRRALEGTSLLRGDRRGGGSRTWRLCAFRQDRRRGVAERAPRPKAVVRGGETQDQPHNRHVPAAVNYMTSHVEGLRWHDPISVVGAPSHSYGYGVVAPTHAIARVPRIWGSGIPGTRALARVAPTPPSNHLL